MKTGYKSQAGHQNPDQDQKTLKGWYRVESDKRVNTNKLIL